MADENETLVDGKALSSLRVVDLKQELKKRGLKTNGSKAYLQNLLKVYIESENASNAAISCDANDANNDRQNSLKNAQIDEQNQLSNTLSSNLDESSECHDDSNIANNEKNESSVDDGSNLVADDNDGDNKSDKTEEEVEMSETNDEKRDTNAEFTVFASEESASNSVFKDNNNETARDETNAETLVDTDQQNTNAFKVISENVSEDGVDKLDSNEEVKSDVVVERDVSERENKRELNETEPETDKIELTSDETVSQIVNNENNNNQELEESKITESTNDTLQQSDVSDENRESQQTVTTKLESSDVSSIPNPETEVVIKESRHSSDGRERRPPRKRRWGSTTAQDIHNTTNKGISSDQLKELIPDLNTTVTPINNTNINNNNNNNSGTNNSVNTITVKVSTGNKYDLNVNVSSNTNKSQTSITNNENPLKRDIRVVRKSVSVSEENNNTDSRKASSLNVEPMKSQEIVEEEDESKMYTTKSAESNIIFIRNLVRPFTLLQLKDVLGKTGKIIEEQFWIDKIKSKCYVTYETVEEAVATRQALHGTRWPISNPKLLSVDFSTKDELDYHLNLENSSNKDVVINNKSEQNQNNNEKYDILIKTDRDVKIIRENEDISLNKEKEKPELDKNKLENRPIREWDREKLVNNDEKERSRASSKRRPASPLQKVRQQDVSEIKRRRHDSTKGGERNRVSAEKNVALSAQQEPESPAKLLDDLFKKTSATPSIYWLPLTEEQAVARDAKRAEIDKRRKEEREARDEAFRKRQEEMTADRRERENDPTIRIERGPNMRSNSPPNRRFNSPPNRRPNMPPRRPSPYRRASPRRSPNRRSPPRHLANARASRSPINRRNSPPRRRR